MKRPTKIDIFNCRWEIRWVDQASDTATEAWGMCIYDQQVILMSTRMKPNFEADTFLHEVLHAVCKAMGMGERFSEEDAAKKLSSGLCLVWKQNPEVFKWWTQLVQS